MPEETAKLIVNPVAGNGRVQRLWPALRERLARAGSRFVAELTTRPGHATDLAQRALQEGYRRLIVIGGDGTVNEVINGLFNGSAPPEDLLLGMVPWGTGADLVRTLGKPTDPFETFFADQPPTRRRIDVGRMTYQERGLTQHRYFANVAGLGFDGEVARRTNRSSKMGGGTIPYLWNLVLTLAAYRNKDVEILLDNQIVSMRANSIIICNGQYFGGGMWIGPGAQVDDGLFDVIVLGDLGRAELLTSLPRVYKGTHLTHPKVSAFRARRVQVWANSPMLVQVDGEAIGEAPVTFELLPKALSVWS